jgi:fatty-acyl-CoA synthase
VKKYYTYDWTQAERTARLVNLQRIGWKEAAVMESGVVVTIPFIEEEEVPYEHESILEAAAVAEYHEKWREFPRADGHLRNGHSVSGEELNQFLKRNEPNIKRQKALPL